MEPEQEDILGEQGRDDAPYVCITVDCDKPVNVVVQAGRNVTFVGATPIKEEN